MKAFIFDLDGTLLDSLEDLANAGNTVLAGAGYATHPLNAYRNFVGNGLEVLVRRTLPEGEAQRLGTDGVLALVQKAREIYGTNWNVKSRPYPGVIEALKALSRRGVELGVLSNKPHPWTVEIMQHFFAEISFAVVRGAMPAVPLKPDPTAALQVARELDLAADECAFVGDSNVDMLTAVRAGMIPVGVTWGFRDVEELRSAGAQHLVHVAGDLLCLS